MIGDTLHPEIGAATFVWERSTAGGSVTGHVSTIDPGSDRRIETLKLL